MIHKHLICYLLLSFLFIPTHWSQERAIRPLETNNRQALVIGNANYEHAGVLRNPANDAQAIGDTLEELGFRVTTLTEANKRQMDQAIRKFGKDLRNSDGVGLFYYAGHGMQIDGENYLLPTDINPSNETDVSYDAVPVGKLLGQMKDAGNGMNVVILDACRNNPFARSFRSGSRGLAQVIAPAGSFISYATAPGDVAADGEGDNGLFTEKLLQHMTTPGLRLEEVFKRVRADVQQDSNNKQVPWDSSSVTGDFFFVPMAEVAPAMPTAISSGTTPEQDIAVQAWELIKDTEDPRAFETFIQMFPEAPQSNLAKLKLIALASSAPQKAEESMSLPVVTETLSSPVVTDNVVFEKQASTSKETPASSTPPPKTESTAQWSDWAKKPSPPTSATTNNALAGEAAKKRLLEVGNCVECDLTKANLEYAKLNGADLNGADLNGANLRGANLVKANLVKANLEYTLLLYAYLNGANLRGANLRGANLKNAILFEANLENANLENANLNAAKFCNTIMSDGSINNSNCDSNSSKESSSFLEKADPQITGRGMDYSAYQAVEQDSSDVVGCGFFHVGCEEKALTFPAYQPDFHLKGYRRVNLWGKDRPWTDTELQVKSGDVVVFYGKGDVKGIRHNQLRLGILVGNSDTPIVTDKSRKIRYNTEARTISQQIWFYGNLKLAIPDWNTYPPSSQNYDDNSGVLIIDIFVIDPDQEEGFNRFKDALFKANPNDSNAKAYLGR